MQLPFVLQSAEVMKTAVAYLEPHTEKAEARPHWLTLSEELQLHPEQSTDAFVLHHPEAKYFNT
jgi:cobalamin-dependent methionine synthase I